MVLAAGLRWRIGDGSNVNIWEDPWVPRPTTFRIMSPPKQQLKQVKELILPNGKEWNLPLMKAVLSLIDVQVISSIPLNAEECDDKLIWHYCKNGIYNVKSGYQVAQHLVRNGCESQKAEGEGSNTQAQEDVWISLWKLSVPPKLKVFIWKCLHEFIPCKEHLFQKKLIRDTECPSCGAAVESPSHLFFKCDFARAFWFGSPLQLDSKALQGTSFLDVWENLKERVRYSDH